MAIFDIFEEVSEKSVTKTETGDNRIFGIVVGEVVKNYSETMPGRVCVSIHVRDRDANVLKWARVAMPYSGSSWGMYFLPEVGDQVLVVFDQGLIDRPYVIGAIQKDMNMFLRKAKNMHNQHKKIMTKNGNAIEFEDVVTGEGEQDKLTIHTSGTAHELTLDNEKKKITLQDKDKNAMIEMSTLRGNITIKAASKLTINVGENISVTMNGESGKITVNANDVSVQANSKIDLNGGGKATLTGASVKVESQGSLQMSSPGMCTLEGKPIRIG
ncbi:MAG: hypothetical protein IJV04_10630 [Lachnospiraceae bacterium]|nr:hypothetical protein [Lachnospiraceae bacterium]